MEAYEFEDKPHPCWKEYYNCLEQWGSVDARKLIRRLEHLNELDASYLHPILLIADIERELGNTERADTLNTQAYKTAISIVCDDGKWPDRMIWGWDGNRHLLRTFEDYGVMCWRLGHTDRALEVFRRIFKLNPYDNQGIRYKILAIRMGYSFAEHDRVNESNHEAFNFWSDQFTKYAIEFPEDFDAWFKEFGDDN